MEINLLSVVYDMAKGNFKQVVSVNLRLKLHYRQFLPLVQHTTRHISFCYVQLNKRVVRDYVVIRSLDHKQKQMLL